MHIFATVYLLEMPKCPMVYSNYRQASHEDQEKRGAIWVETTATLCRLAPIAQATVPKAMDRPKQFC
ncbi:MAG TPA: hypothetical protein DCZ69_14205 [Syntrophobacteraceae bacterium]|nr:hypothetical protein [Syntrophobacteraceae bacterium]